MVDKINSLYKFNFCCEENNSLTHSVVVASDGFQEALEISCQNAEKLFGKDGYILQSSEMLADKRLSGRKPLLIIDAN